MSSPIPPAWKNFKPMTWTEANEEAAYIKSIDPKHPGQAFNDDPKCFARYCEMQSKHAMMSGHAFQAMEIEALT